MTVLGSIYGVSFVFENEHLAGLEVDRHRIPIYPLRERLISETPLRVAAPAPFLRTGTLAPPSATGNSSRMRPAALRPSRIWGSAGGRSTSASSSASGRTDARRPAPEARRSPYLGSGST